MVSKKSRYQIGETPYFVEVDQWGYHLVERRPRRGGGDIFAHQCSYSNIGHLCNRGVQFLIGLKGESERKAGLNELGGDIDEAIKTLQQFWEKHGEGLEQAREELRERIKEGKQGTEVEKEIMKVSFA